MNNLVKIDDAVKTIKAAYGEGVQVDIDKLKAEGLIVPAKWGRVKLTKGQTYWIIDSFGDVEDSVWNDDLTDNARWEQGNTYLSKQEAIDARDWLIKNADRLYITRALEKFAEENNEGKIDWKDMEQDKYSFSYDYDDKKLDIDRWSICQYNTVQFTSKELTQKALDHFGEDAIKCYLGVE